MLCVDRLEFTPRQRAFQKHQGPGFVMIVSRGMARTMLCGSSPRTKTAEPRQPHTRQHFLRHETFQSGVMGVRGPLPHVWQRFVLN